jgi:hypothetical protein
MPKIPVLGKDYESNGWRDRIHMMAEAIGYGHMLMDPNALLDAWPKARIWLIDGVKEKDFHRVKDATSWVAVMNALKAARCMSDDINAIDLNVKP